MGQTNIRIMSFNLQCALSRNKDGTLTEKAENRIAAVCREICDYDPDLLGVQEDKEIWQQKLRPKNYTRIRIDGLGENLEADAIYVKKGIRILASGNCALSDQPNGERALTLNDLITPGSPYEMTPDDLAWLDIDPNGPEDVLIKPQTWEGGTYNRLLPHRMSYVVIDCNGTPFIYVNTHLMHRGQFRPYNRYKSEEDRKALRSPLQTLRCMERLKSFDIIQRRIDHLRLQFPGASVAITGDFNDLVDSPIYRRFSETMRDSSLVAEERLEPCGTWNHAFCMEAEGDNYPSEKEGTGTSKLDYCFVSPDLRVIRYETGSPKATITLADGTKKTIYTSDHLPLVVDVQP